MSQVTSKSKSPSNGLLPPQQQGQPARTSRLSLRAVNIRVKLTLLTLAMIALITTGSSLVAIENLDQELFNNLAKRGASIALSAAIPAGYSILADDRLALDNLAAKIEASQEDIIYVAILDNDSTVLAHNQLSETGMAFETTNGPSLLSASNFTMQQVNRNGLSSYEFKSPIEFADNRVGQIVVGIDTQMLHAAKESVRRRILMLSLAVLAIGSMGAFMLSKLFTAPIERLAAGVSEITAGHYHVEVKVTSKDELGRLTQSFNDMSKVIMSQKQHLEDYSHNLEESYVSTIKILAAALDARDNYTLGHSARVARLSLLIGQRLGLNDAELKDLEMACFLHDIGKIHIPDVIINKPVPLNHEETHIIKKHPEQGAAILRLAESLHKYIPVILHHHEWYNGQGYPHGLQGDEINIFAQIVSIADTYDAMTTSRPYRKGCSREEATAEIMKYRGTQFNPELADIFLVALDYYDDHQDLFSSGGQHETNHFQYPHSASITDDINRMRFTPPRHQDAIKPNRRSTQ
jgi:putative nucleotidyltransferase with HDIG domain